MKKQGLLKILAMCSVVGVVSSCDFPIFVDPFDSHQGGSSIDFTSSYYQSETRHTAYDLNVCREQESFAPIGDKKLLVLPITIKGYERNATEANRENIRKTFFGDASETHWQSVSSFYEESSFGQFNLYGEVADWFDSGLTPTELAEMGNEDQEIGVIDILNRAIEAYKEKTGSDCTDYDYDGDGFIDGVWMVYSAPDYSHQPSLPHTSFWAYTYWNVNAEPSIESPVGKAFCWASYDFMYEGYGSIGNRCLDAHTYIHETGHLLGLDDYYDYNRRCAPMGGLDMMDYNIIDHNVFSKFLFGWVKPYIIDEPGSIKIRPSATTGDCVLIPTSKRWNESVYDEYIMLEYYTPTGLNLQDSIYRYGNNPLGFTENGVRIYHVDARLVQITSSGKYDYTDEIEKTITGLNWSYSNLAHSNTPGSEYGASRNFINPDFRLIQEMDCTRKRNFAKSQQYSASADNGSLFQRGDSFSLEKYSDSFPKGTKMNNGHNFDYEIVIDSMNNDYVEITFNEI
ncbi:MAG: hypothetical protein MJ238_01400 [Bacilli bacterium]|nr:hypothetical protein [Bacilli bacterium]